jgi:hypothetical protein
MVVAQWKQFRFTPLRWRPRPAIRHCKRVAQAARFIQLQRRTGICEAAAAGCLPNASAGACNFIAELEFMRSMRMEDGISSKINNRNRVVLLLEDARKGRISSKCETVRMI